MFAAGNYANMVPGKKPDWPAGNTIRQSIAIGTADDSNVHTGCRGNTRSFLLEPLGKLHILLKCEAKTMKKNLRRKGDMSSS
jgi:hypothetical protein